MRPERAIRERLDEITRELEGGRCTQTRLIVLYNRRQALRWALGDISSEDDV